MKAVGFFVIVKELSSSKTVKSKHGLLLTEKDREDIRYVKASIVSVGDPKFSLKEGDVVLYDKFAGSIVENEGDNYKVIKTADIAVVL
jgi:co-chaperonin GroES (HSP10)